MPKFRIYYGLGLIPDYSDVVEAKNLEDAENAAREAAIELANNEMIYSAEEVKEDSDE